MFNACCIRQQFIVFFVVAIIFMYSAGDSSARDYYLDFPSLAQPRAAELEWSAELFGMNDQLDLFDFRAKSDACANCSGDIVFGDSQGVKFLLTYGINDTFSAHGEYSRWSLENGFDNVNIDSGVMSLRKKMGSSLVAEVGARGNRGSSLQVTEYNRLKILLNYLLRDNDFSFIDGASHFIIKHEGTTLYLDKSDEPIRISVSGMRDLTSYGRLLYGLPAVKRLNTTLFLEGGKSWTDTDIHVSLHPELAQLVPLPQLRVARTETYLKSGIDFLVKGPWGTVWDLNWYYERLFREEDLNYVEYNQVLNGDLLIPLYRAATLRLGGSWYRRQFNGVVPFAYNQFTQTTFDHDYGTLRLGVVVSMQ